MGLAVRTTGTSGLVVGLLLSLVATAAAQQSTQAPPLAPAAGEVITLGADMVVLDESFTSGDRWGLAEDENGSISNTDGTLRLAIAVAPSAKWTWSELGTEAPVLWMRTDVGLSAAGGAAGPMCGTGDASPAFIFGVVTTADEWVIGRILENALTVLSRGPLPGSTSLREGDHAVVSLECAMTGAGGDRAALWVNGVNVADLSLEQADGPFSRAGLLAEGYASGFEARIDDVVVATGSSYTPVVREAAGGAPAAVASMAPITPPASAAAVNSPPPVPIASPPPVPIASRAPAPVASAPIDDLVAHVPPAFAGNCTAAAADPDHGLLDSVQCAPVGEVASAAYFRYASTEQLEGAFDALLQDKGAVTDGTDCSVGPALVEYTIGDVTAGRLACYLVDGTAVVQWTNRDLRTMGFGAGPSGRFSKVFPWRQDAGPLP
jgi:hypothetical protein